MYCFILPIIQLIQLVDERRRLILAYSHWFRNFNSMQRAADNEV